MRKKGIREKRYSKEGVAIAKTYKVANIILVCRSMVFSFFTQRKERGILGGGRMGKKDIRSQLRRFVGRVNVFFGGLRTLSIEIEGSRNITQKKGEKKSNKKKEEGQDIGLKQRILNKIMEKNILLRRGTNIYIEEKVPHKGRRKKFQKKDELFEGGDNHIGVIIWGVYFKGGIKDNRI